MATAPILMFTDNISYNERIRQHGQYLDEMNEILGDYNVLGLAPLTGTVEITSLFTSPVDFVFDRMTGGQPVVIGGLPVNRADAMKIMSKPAGYDTLLAMIDAFKQHHPGWANILNDKDIVGGAIVVSQAVKDAELAACKIYAVGDSEQKLFAFAQDVMAAAANRFGNLDKINVVGLVQRCIVPIRVGGTAIGQSIEYAAIKGGI